MVAPRSATVFVPCESEKGVGILVTDARSGRRVRVRDAEFFFDSENAIYLPATIQSTDGDLVKARFNDGQCLWVHAKRPDEVEME